MALHEKAAGSRRSRAADRAQPDLFAPPPARHRPGPIRVGTSGYSFVDWVGPFYPPGTPRRAMLDHYRRFFSTVEVNSTYYRLPPPATMRSMAERTPADFRFMVKLPGDLTHAREGPDAPSTAFRRTVEPLVTAGRFAGALAQFPFAFHRSRESEAYLDRLRASLPEVPLFVEFRHASWDAPDLAPMLEAKGLGFCSVDEPDLPGLLPRKALVAGETAYVRFHGRNARAWWSGGPERYDYRYDEKELEEWAQVIRELAQHARQTYVFFNNCHAGHAVVNARMMEELLGLEPERG
jgi:uncharacterized protein YecE (DUF72 family)